MKRDQISPFFSIYFQSYLRLADLMERDAVQLSSLDTIEFHASHEPEDMSSWILLSCEEKKGGEQRELN